MSWHCDNFLPQVKNDRCLGIFMHLTRSHHNAILRFVLFGVPKSTGRNRVGQIFENEKKNLPPSHTHFSFTNLRSKIHISWNTTIWNIYFSNETPCRVFSLCQIKEIGSLKYQMVWPNIFVMHTCTNLHFISSLVVKIKKIGWHCRVRSWP